MTAQLEELNERVDTLRKQRNQEVLTLVEILSNATFFGEIKKTNCEYTKNGQCGFFILSDSAKNKIPIATECRIWDCKTSIGHCHLELSNITCSLCQITNNSPKRVFSQFTLKEPRKVQRKEPRNFQRIGPRLNKHQIR